MQEKVSAREYSFYLSILYTYLNRYLTTAFYEKFSVMGMLYLLCCAINMYGVNPGGQKAQGLPRGWQGPGEFWLQSEMPLYWPPSATRPLLVIEDGSRKEKESTAQCHCC